MFEQLSRLLFAVATGAIGLGLGLPSVAEREASANPQPWSCAQLIAERPEGWVRVDGCQLDLAVALYEEDHRGMEIVRAWVPGAVAPVPTDGTPAPLIIRTSDPQTLANLNWGRDAVTAAGDDPKALQNVLETFQQAGERHLIGNITWQPTSVMRDEYAPLEKVLARDVGFLRTEPPPWLPGWGWTLVGVLGLLLGAWSAWSWYRQASTGPSVEHP